MELTNGLTITGLYISPKTKTHTAEKFLRDEIEMNGLKHRIAGDFNDRSQWWDTKQNERGLEVIGMARECDRMYLAAASHPIILQIIKMKNGSYAAHSNNPYIVMSYVQGTAASVESKDWKNFHTTVPCLYKCQTA